jgi:hypothetical protein
LELKEKRENRKAPSLPWPASWRSPVSPPLSPLPPSAAQPARVLADVACPVATLVALAPSLARGPARPPSAARPPAHGVRPRGLVRGAAFPARRGSPAPAPSQRDPLPLPRARPALAARPRCARPRRVRPWHPARPRRGCLGADAPAWPSPSPRAAGPTPPQPLPTQPCPSNLGVLAARPRRAGPAWPWRPGPERPRPARPRPWPWPLPLPRRARSRPWRPVRRVRCPLVARPARGAPGAARRACAARPWHPAWCARSQPGVVVAPSLGVARPCSPGTAAAYSPLRGLELGPSCLWRAALGSASARPACSVLSWPRCLLAARSAVRVQLSPGVRAARSRRARVLAWCTRCFGTARRALGALVYP